MIGYNSNEIKKIILFAIAKYDKYAIARGTPIGDQRTEATRIAGGTNSGTPLAVSENCGHFDPRDGSSLSRFFRRVRARLNTICKFAARPSRYRPAAPRRPLPGRMNKWYAPIRPIAALSVVEFAPDAANYSCSRGATAIKGQFRSRRPCTQ